MGLLPLISALWDRGHGSQASGGSSTGSLRKYGVYRRPAYNAGIQSGDIITRLGMAELATMKDFQNCLDKLSSGDVVTVEIQRYGQNRYTPIEYEVTIGAR